MKKTVIITGANTGIGKATALGLAGKGYHVIMACRSKEKGEKAQSEIIAKTQNTTVDLLLLDLSSQDSIREFVKKVNSTYPTIEILINNAGVSIREPKQTEQGIEWTFAVNHLGPFLLTNLLLNTLKKSSPSRIITVASSVERQAKLNLRDVNLKYTWNGYLAYANSKLCNIYFTYELSKRLMGTHVTANCLGPGLVNSDFFRNYAKLPWPFKIIKKLIGKTPEEGAETSLFLALSPEVEGVSGKYFENCREKKSSSASYNPEIAAALWDISMELCDLT